MNTYQETKTDETSNVYQHQYFASTSISLIEVQAQLLVIQDLLKTILIQQGGSQELIDAQCITALDTYREALTQKFSESLSQYKEPFIKALDTQLTKN